MATASEVSLVRDYTDEPMPGSPYTDEYLGAFIDASSVLLASGSIWRIKAAKYAELVSVSEAGASRAMSDLFKHAQEMAAHYEKAGEEEQSAAAGGGRVKIHTIQRLE